MADHVDEYLQKGMYGEKQTKPDERRKFLGTLRERIVLALTQPQVRKNGINHEAEKAMKENSQAHLYLNGNMNYEYLSKYIKSASKYKVEYTIVTNKEHNSEIGLVLAYDYAIDKESIFVDDDKPQIQPETKKQKTGFFARLFGGK
ncbi:YueI family protein [Bacillus mesophilum]|uniref:YueI family protein n=1 Tax=Bacillus mesophilum TaxID=1071718 RepID=A0A7V7RK72_9BACI|nr:YueI family protein [Bacillus mesophilum]KAB2331659.1 YueI family protein [Bacillus mesophilum]